MGFVLLQLGRPLNCGHAKYRMSTFHIKVFYDY